MKATMIRLLSTPAARIVLVLVALAGGYEVRELYEGRTPALPWQPAAAAGEMAAAPAAALKTVEFQCLSCYLTKGGLLLCNDKEDYKEEGARTVVIDTKRGKFKGWSEENVLGKTLKVKGKASTYKGKPQLVAVEVNVQQ